MRLAEFERGARLLPGLLIAGCLTLSACTGVLGGDSPGAADTEDARSESSPSEGGAEGGSAGTLTGPDGMPIVYEPAGTPLARLTNDEFFTSAVRALKIPEDAEGLAEARGTFAAEAVVGGLVNDVEVQRLTQLAVIGFSNLATAAADAFLHGVVDQAGLRQKMGCTSSSEFQACSLEFGKRLMEDAYRRELTADDVAALESVVSRFDAILQAEAAGTQSIEADRLRVTTIIRFVLIAPDFLLLVEHGAADGGVQTISSIETASRLSYLLVGESPDADLLAAAHADELLEPESRVSHARRLLESEKGRARVQDAMMLWLGINPNAVEPASVDSLAGFIDDWFENQRPFAHFYEAPIPVSHLDGSSSEEPFGVLGMDAFLGSHTFPPSPAFITRGVFVVERLLCAELPADVPAEALDSEEERTDLQVFEVHAQQPCATCHVIFDNYGAALQQFDGATGLFQSDPTELGIGFELFDLGGISGAVDGPHDLAATMASSERAPRCMAELWYRSAMRRSLDHDKDDTQVVDVLVDTWNASGDTSLQSLLLALVASEQFVAFVP